MINKHKITLLDGGMGQELFHRSKIKPDTLWSARVLLDDYDLVVETHKDFIRSGVDAISLNSYSVTPQRLKRHNLEDMFLPLQKKAIKAANDAISLVSTRNEVSLLGCLPPLIMSYRTSLGMEKKEAIDTYKKIIDIQEPHVDIFICETVCSIEEASVVSEVALNSNKKVWLSFSVDEEDGALLRSGEKLEDALKEFNDSKINAFLINCSPIESVYKAINIMKNYSKQFGALPNGFETVKPFGVGVNVSSLKKRNDFNKKKFVNAILSYLENNASIVGGCCEVGPEYISAIHSEIYNLN